MRIVVIIPTYNEKDNVENIVTEVFEQAQAMPKHELHVLIADDNSPDGTGKIVERLIETYPRLHLLRGQKEGLGAAYVRGFKAAMEKMQADVVVEMDADGSHPPTALPKLIEVIDNGADVAVGTRYITGGSIPADWGFLRKFLSGIGNLIARVLLLLPQYHDMTTGFRATRTTVLRKINLDALLSKRFAYKIHLFHALYMEGAKIVEVPFHFVDRDKGSSKMITNDIIDSLRVIVLIRIHQSKHIIKFLIVGTIGFFINTVVLYVLDDTSLGSFLPPQDIAGHILFFPIKDLRLFWASIIAVEVSIICLFFFHERWTFKDRDRSGHPIKRFSRFNITALGSPIISVVTINILTPHFGFPKIISLAIGTIIGLFYNYTMNILVIWREHPENKD